MAATAETGPQNLKSHQAAAWVAWWVTDCGHGAADDNKSISGFMCSH